jgi:ATP-dependent DNA helicase RecG
MVVKLGRFGTTDDDLRFQETEEGNIIQLLKEVPDQLNHKFFTKPVDFEGLQRIEKGEYPVAALREMLLNALVHRDYMGSMVQIRMYDNRFSIWNEGFLPQGLTLEALKRQHPSRPRNPLIAEVCFKGGYIDAWGRGTLKIINSCKEAGLPEPEMKEQDGGMLVILFKDKFNENQLQKMGLNIRQINAVKYVMENGSITNAVFQQLNHVGKSTATVDLQQLVDLELFSPSTAKGRGSKYTLKN